MGPYKTSAHEQMKRMLDELMGSNRNGEPEGEKIHFSNPRVCKNFLLDCCVHDILSTTRCDLGKCPKLHNYAFRADYEAACKTQDFDFHSEVLLNLKNFIAETERRTHVAKQRLADAKQVLTANESIVNIKIQAIENQIKELLEQMEKLGEEGKVDESLKISETVEELRKKKATIKQEYKNSVPTSRGQQQQLRVCEVCSSYLGLDDNDERLADHFKGRLHLGYAKIRKKIEELTDYIQEKHIKNFLDKEFKSFSQGCFSSSTPMLYLPPPSQPYNASIMPGKRKNPDDPGQDEYEPSQKKALQD